MNGNADKNAEAFEKMAVEGWRAEILEHSRILDMHSEIMARIDRLPDDLARVVRWIPQDLARSIRMRKEKDVIDVNEVARSLEGCGSPSVKLGKTWLAARIDSDDPMPNGSHHLVEIFVNGKRYAVYPLRESEDGVIV
jgi:hypothetical protein